ncbi:probable hexose phosphate transport protein [Oppia nitens]|uniref:probable hexose phosphate transport protein n=1 Tax=Oppia nitens TaxID=1686743 RepID=UPI0023DB5087|nr:probable hexose phosphate transport protein [Oppia nitens]
MSIGGLSSLLITLPAGLLVDRISPKLMLVTGLLVASIATGVFALSTTLANYTMSWFIKGLGDGLALATYGVLIRRVASPSKMASLTAMFMMTYNIAGIVEPVLANTLIQWFNWRVYVLVNSSLVALVLVASILFLDTGANPNPDDTNKNKLDKKHHDKTNPSSMLNVLANPLQWTGIGAMFTLFLSRMVLGQWAKIYLSNSLGQDNYISMGFDGFINMAALGANFFIAYLSDRAIVGLDKPSLVNYRFKMLMILGIVYTVGLHLFSFQANQQSSWLFFILIACLIGLGMSGSALHQSLLIYDLDPMNPGIWSAINMFAITGSSILAGYPISSMADSYGWQQTYIGLEMLCIGAVALTFLVTKYYVNKIKQD